MTIGDHAHHYIAIVYSIHHLPIDPIMGTRSYGALAQGHDVYKAHTTNCKLYSDP